MVDGRYFTRLDYFLEYVQHDGRVGPIDISLYLAILQYSSLNDCMNPIAVFARELMPVAKISAQTTYRKCLHTLEDAGFIKYYPSCSHYVRSNIQIIGVG